MDQEKIEDLAVLIFVFIIFMGILLMGSISLLVDGAFTVIVGTLICLIVGILAILSIFKLYRLLAHLVLKYKTEFDLNRKKK